MSRAAGTFFLPVFFFITLMFFLGSLTVSAVAGARDATRLELLVCFFVFFFSLFIYLFITLIFFRFPLHVGAAVQQQHQQQRRQQQQQHQQGSFFFFSFLSITYALTGTMTTTTRDTTLLPM